MSGLKLVIGTRNASSWSLRAWLLLKQLDLAFDEVVIPLQQPDTALHIGRYSPSGKVPVLLVDGLRIWDTLAIAEFMAERYPTLWPDDTATRAFARSVVCEMHSGFAALRTFMPMDFTARFGPPGKLLAAVEGDVERIQAIWAGCRQFSAEPGPFLFGSFTIADAMFAPVCSRFTTHAVPLDAASRAYVESMMGLPAMQAWGQAAAADLERVAREPWTVAAVPEPAAPPLAVPEPQPRRLPERPPAAASPLVEPAPQPASVAPEPEPPPVVAPQPAPPTWAPMPVEVAEPPAELRRAPRPIPSTIMVKPIGDGTRRRR
ncbi:MAG: glutathione S-transferase family protein [Geminicoccaceae bacterium]